MAAVEERPETTAIASTARKNKERDSLERLDNLKTALCDCRLSSFLFFIMASPITLYLTTRSPIVPPSAHYFGL